MNTTPRHHKPHSKEFQAAQRIVELYRKAFEAHGIITPIHAPNLAQIADTIAGVPLSSPYPRVISDASDHEGLIDL